MPSLRLPRASSFSIVLGLSGLGQAWRAAAKLWAASAEVGEGLLAASTVVWLGLLVGYGVLALRDWAAVREEFAHPVQGAAPALLGISTLLVSLAVLPHARLVAEALAVAGIGWQVAFSLWHAGDSWRGGRLAADTAPNIYLPTVAGNFTAAAVLGTFGFHDWAWAFLGVGFFSWIALESIMLERLWRPDHLALDRRALIGIQFAPPAVMAMAWTAVAPGQVDRLLLMLWGYALFQLLLGARLWRWLSQQPFSSSYWSYTFGIGSAATVTLRLALDGVTAARQVAPIVFAMANMFVLALVLCTLARLRLPNGRLQPN